MNRRTRLVTIGTVVAAAALGTAGIAYAGDYTAPHGHHGTSKSGHHGHHKHHGHHHGLFGLMH